MDITRRQLLGLGGGAAVAGVAAWAGLLRDDGSSPPRTSPGASSAVAAGSRVLVLVQMSGGNGALNTLVPLDGRYHDARPTLGLADDTLVALRGQSGYGLHPSLQPLTSLWESDRLALVPGVGFASDSRSHFDSLAVWWSASPDHSQSTGWLGRWLDQTGVAADNPLAAVSLGGGAVPALRADHSLSTAVNDLATFRFGGKRNPAAGAALEQLVAATATPASTDPLLAAAQASYADAVRAVDLLAKVGPGAGPGAGSSGTASSGTASSDSSASSSGNAVEGDDTDPSDGTAGPITSSLATAAELLGMGLGTRVILVSAAGFDTHAGQADTQARLLADLAGGITSFFATLDQKGIGDDVLLLTTSEFGRRVAENGSGGTDHGLGGVHLLAGRPVKAGLHGAVDLGDLTEGDLKATTDTRAMYASAIDWLGGPTDDVLGKGFDTHDLVAA